MRLTLVTFVMGIQAGCAVAHDDPASIGDADETHRGAPRGSGGEGGNAIGDDGDGGADGGPDSAMDSSVLDPPVMCDDERDCTAEPRLLCGPEGTCVQCTDEAPCDGADVCDETGSCVQCLDDEQCEDDVLRPVCRTDRKQCVACTGDEHCLVGARQRCSEDNECVECLNDGHCTAETADFCIANSCEQCRDDDDCSAAAGTPLCDDATKTCIAECTSHGDCTDPTKAQCDSGNCVACDADAQCGGVQRGGKGAEVCDDGECWECTGTKYDACGVDAGDNHRAFVCDSRARTCSDQKEEDAGACKPCVSDAHCVPGQFCIEEQFGDPAEVVGWFCFWDRFSDAVDAPDGDCAGVRPFVSTLADATSIDRQTATVCRLGATNCAAFNDINQDCESAQTAGQADASLCGFSHSEENYSTHEDQDGYCVDVDPTAAVDFRCTTPCFNDDEACKVGTSCDTSPEPDLCTLPGERWWSLVSSILVVSALKGGVAKATIPTPAAKTPRATAAAARAARRAVMPAMATAGQAPATRRCRTRR